MSYDFPSPQRSRYDEIRDQAIRRRNKRVTLYWVLTVLAVVALFAAIPACGHIMKGTEHTVRATVSDKERVCNSSGNHGQKCQYLIYTDHGTFKLADSHLIGVFWRTNSSDLYGAIKRDTTYDFKLIGFRFGLTSTYPNIEKATPVPKTVPA